MQRRKCLPKCWVAGDHKDLQEPNIFFPWPQHVNHTKKCFHCAQCSGFVALWCFGHTFVSLPSLGKTEWRTQPWKNCKTIAQCASKLRLMMYNVGLGLIIIAAIRASKRAETKVISDLAAWSESWLQLKFLDQRHFQLKLQCQTNGVSNGWPTIVSTPGQHTSIFEQKHKHLELEPHFVHKQRTHNLNCQETSSDSRRLRSGIESILRDQEDIQVADVFFECIRVDWCVHGSFCLW